jgi:hypothetical protein
METIGTGFESFSFERIAGKSTKVGSLSNAERESTARSLSSISSARNGSWGRERP